MGFRGVGFGGLKTFRATGFWVWVESLFGMAVLFAALFGYMYLLARSLSQHVLGDVEANWFRFQGLGSWLRVSRCRV